MENFAMSATPAKTDIVWKHIVGEGVAQLVMVEHRLEIQTPEV